MGNGIPMPYAVVSTVSTIVLQLIFCELATWFSNRKNMSQLLEFSLESSPEDLSGKEGAHNDSVSTSCLQEELITVFSFVNQNHSMLLQNVPQLCMAFLCRRIIRIWIFPDCYFIE